MARILKAYQFHRSTDLYGDIPYTEAESNLLLAEALTRGWYTTGSAEEAYNRREELGHMSPFAIADVAILKIRDGNFGYFKTAGYRMEGSQKLESEMTIKGGRIVWDLNGIANPLNNYYRDGAQFRGHRF